jgi:hypothetical protein
VGHCAQQDQTAELAMKAQNPVADLMIMPLQYNIDFGIGPADASRQTIFKFLESIQSKELGSRTMRGHSPRGTTGNFITLSRIQILEPSRHYYESHPFMFRM